MTGLAISSLRRAGPADFNIIAALEAACFGASDGAFSRRQLHALLRNPNAFWLISYDGRAMACWLKAANGCARWARLYSLAVHPSLRGHGIGKQMIQAGFEWMKQQGLSICRAEVKTDNDVARRLYTTLGFTEDRLLRNYYAKGVDGMRLRLAL